MGCASPASNESALSGGVKCDFPANAVVRTETAFTAPEYSQAILAPYQSTYAVPFTVTAFEPQAVTTPVYGRVAENGSYYGQPNVNEFPKTVAVGGYYRKDGTYVRGHYRSPPGSNPPSTRRRK